jgi:hypothetical protein
VAGSKVTGRPVAEHLAKRQHPAHGIGIFSDLFSLPPEGSRQQTPPAALVDIEANADDPLRAVRRGWNISKKAGIAP